MSRWVLSDLHGCLRTFKKALRVIDFTKNDSLIICGDYIDRGLDSAGVIKEIMNLQKEGYDVVALKGNHEVFLLESMDNSQVFKSWRMNGATETLNSYGWFESGYVKPDWKTFIPESHIEWLSNLPLIHQEWDDFVFCHATLDFSTENPLTDSSEDCILWARTGYVDSSKIGGRILVTGHTPTHKDDMISMVQNARKNGRIIVDRGCVYNSSNYGHLAIMNLDTLQINFIKNIDSIENDRGMW